MHTLIVYFSLEGNTEYAALEISNKLRSDMVRLVPKKAYSDKGFSKFFWGGKSAVMAEKPELEKLSTDLEDYDQIVLGFPVWAATFAPPLRTFVLDNKDVLSQKRISAYACQSGSGAEKALAKLADCIGIQEFYATTILIDPKSKKTEANAKAIDDFCQKLCKEAEQV